MKELFLKRRVYRGFCRYCGERKVILNTQYCVACKERLLERKRRLRKRRREEGRCWECDRVVERYSRCVIHRQKTAEGQRNRNRRRRER